MDYTFELLSFDVSSLFTKISVDHPLDFISGSLDQLLLPVSDEVFLVFKILRLIFRPKFGMTMGLQSSVIHTWII